MRILFLGPETSTIYQTLQCQDDTVLQTEGRVEATDADWIVSHGYRHILKQPVLDAVGGKAVNCHISLLPWNRGADPNFWSFMLDTPKGVTIHYIDEGIDTGDIIVQQEVGFHDRYIRERARTLRHTYECLQDILAWLFRQNWPAIRAGSCARIPQSGVGSSQAVQDLAILKPSLSDNLWDTPIVTLKERFANAQETFVVTD